MIAGTYCLCIENALAGVPPDKKLPGTNSCRHCWGYGCNSPKHPGILARPLYKRLRKAPYYRVAGATTGRTARKLAREEMLRQLRAGWEAVIQPPWPVGHCSRCSRYLPLKPDNRRCAYCERL